MSNYLLQQSWQRAWSALAVKPEADLFQQLVACYSESHRHYHTLQHLQECIEHLEAVLDQAAHPGEIEVALWFHDAVYDMQRSDNELRSALWARQAALTAGAPETVAERVFTLVMATQHLAVPPSPDACLLVDSDLAILGAPPQRFAAYEHQVREEYAWVPLAEFRYKRQAILQSFLNRKRLFSTRYFYNRFETQARANLQQSLLQLDAELSSDSESYSRAES